VSVCLLEDPLFRLIIDLLAIYGTIELMRKLRR